jgi:hypothetical protein
VPDSALPRKKKGLFCHALAHISYARIAYIDTRRKPDIPARRNVFWKSTDLVD